MTNVCQLHWGHHRVSSIESIYRKPKMKHKQNKASKNLSTLLEDRDLKNVYITNIIIFIILYVIIVIIVVTYRSINDVFLPYS